MIKIHEICGWTAAKDLNYPDGNEDAFAIDSSALSFALSDGASNDSYASALWAQTIVETFINHPFMNESAIAAARIFFRDAVKADDLKSFRRVKYLNGSYATFLGLKIWPSEEVYCAQAVGDSFLFVFDGDELVETFPSMNQGFKPLTLSNREDRNILNGKHIMLRSECFLLRDAKTLRNPKFYMMTDALGLWFAQQNFCPKLIDSIDSEDNFIDFVDIARQQKNLVIDDTTLLRIVFSRS